MNNTASNPKMFERKYLRPCEVAEYYGVSVRTLMRAAKSGTFPRPVRVGGQWRWWTPTILEHDRRLNSES